MKRILSVTGFILFAMLFVNVQKAYADHMMGADITYTHVSKNKYKITVTFYRDCLGIPPPTSATVTVHNSCKNYNLSVTCAQVGDSCREVSDLCPSQKSKSSCHGGTLPGVQQCFYAGTIDLGDTCKDWVFSWSSCCRSKSLTNITGYVGLYVEAHLNNTHVDNFKHNSSVFTVIPVVYVCQGQTKQFNQGSFSPDGDSLGYHVQTPQIDATTKVTYASGFTAKYPLTCAGSFHFNDTTGQFTFTPTKLQVTAIAIVVTQYHKYKGKWVKVGSIMRDIQIDVIKCTGTTPTASGIINLKGGSATSPTSFNLCAGLPCSFTVYATDSDTSRTVTFNSNLSTVLPAASVKVHSNKKYLDSVDFSWVPGGTDTGLHNLVFTFTNNDCPVNGSSVINYSIYVSPATYAGPDQYICFGSKKGVQLKAVGGSGFVWTPPKGLNNDSIRNPTARPDSTTTYIVTSNLISTCKNKDTVVVFVSPAVNSAITAKDSALCFGDSTILTAHATGGNGHAFVYSWSTDGGGLGTDSVLHITPDGTTRYYLISNNSYCPAYDTITINVHPIPRADFTIIKPAVCPGVAMSAAYTDSIAGAYKFLWDFGGLNSGGIVSGPGPISVSSYASGSYTVNLTVIDTTYKTQCVKSSFRIATIYPKPVAKFAIVDTAGCVNFNVNVKNLSTGLTAYGNQYNWDLGFCNSTDSIPTCSITVPGYYNVKLIVTNGDGCKDTVAKVKAIYVVPFPIASYTSDKKANDTIDLSIATVKYTNTSQYATLYTWNFSDGTGNLMDSAAIVSHTFKNDGAFYARLKACDIYGCCDTTRALYTVYNFNDFFVPTAFTPNSDRFNDHLGVLGKYIIKAKLSVYDRWGNLMYQGSDNDVICNYHCASRGWDGTLKGTKCPQGVYIWYAECDMVNGEHLKKKGDVTLIR